MTKKSPVNCSEKRKINCANMSLLRLSDTQLVAGRIFVSGKIARSGFGLVRIWRSAMDVLQDVFGKFVLDRKGCRVPVSSLAGPDKIIGIYFYGNWCLPCQHFSKQLKLFYNNLKSTGKGDNFEIVAISSNSDDDDDEDPATDVLPFLMADYKSRSQIMSISQRFGVESVPTLILLDGETGETITECARKHVIEDPDALNFPWRDNLVVKKT